MQPINDRGRRLRAACVALAVLTGLSGLAAAQSSHDGGHAHHAAPPRAVSPQAEGEALAPPAGVSVQGCWVRAMPGRLPSAAYFVLGNEGQHAVTLTSVHTDAYGQVMMHTTRMVDGMATMAMLGDTTVPAGGRLVFEPGGHHVMLERAVQPPVVGSSLSLAFRFEGGGVLTAECDVLGPAGRRPAP